MSGTTKHKILLVDDTPEDLQLLVLTLKDDYTIVVATSGEMAVEVAQTEPKPQLVLMDVTMQGMNGYEACEKIIASDPNMAVLFVSANDSTDEVLRGYEVGGIDYIIKPFQPEILLTKIDAALKDRMLHEEMHSKSDMATKTAMLAMTTSAEQAVIVEFLKGSFECATNETIAQLLLDVLSSYELAACVQIVSKHYLIELSHSGVVHPVESDLMGRMRDYKDRTLSLKNRMFLQYGDVTLLIKNMPIEDDDRCGRLRDYLQTIIHGAAVKQQAIEFQLGIEYSRNMELGDVAAQVKTTLAQIKTDNETHKKRSVDVFDRLRGRMEESFLSLGLTDDQEQIFMEIIDEAVQESLEHIEAGIKIDDKLKNIIVKLSELST